MTTISSALSFTSPHPSSNHTQCVFDDEAMRLLLTVVYSLLFLLGLVGNVFALWVFLFLHSSRNSVQVFLINCAVADVIFLACLPFRVFFHVNGNQWELGAVACKLVGNLFYMNMYISIMLLGFISLDRYLRINGKGGLRRDVRITVWGHSRPWSWVACGTLWGVALVVLVPMTVMAEDKENSNKCFHYKWRRDIAQWKAYVNVALVVFFWLVFIMLVVSYAKIASQLLRVSRNKPDLPNAQRYKRTAKKSFFVLFLFTVCFGPYHAFRPVYILYQLSEPSCDSVHLVDRTNEVMLLLSAFNSCLDPIMYFLLSSSVRKTALRTLGHWLGNRLGNRLLFLNDATSNSSMEFRRPSVPMALPNPAPNTPSLREQVSVSSTPPFTAQD